jgi:hypothetical protein
MTRMHPYEKLNVFSFAGAVRLAEWLSAKTTPRTEGCR